MFVMNRKIVFSAVTIMSMMLIFGCGNRGREEEHDNVLTMELARLQEPQLMTTDEIVGLVKSDTTHKKVVYWFDIMCKPCRQHLQDEIASFYALHDTTEWRIYLVAGFNGLHRYVPDADGNLVEDANCISYYSAEYHKLLPSLGFDMKDVYMHYDPLWEKADAKEVYPDGIFTGLANMMFHSDVPFRCEFDGVPRVFKSDRDNQLLVDYCIFTENGKDTLRFYIPDDSYKFEIDDFSRHDTIVVTYMN